MDISFEEIHRQAQENLDSWAEIYPKLEELNIDRSSKLPQLERSVSSLDRQLTVRMELILSSKPLPSASLDLLPQSQTAGLVNGLTNIGKHIDQLSENLAAIEEGGGLEVFTESSLQAQTKAGQNVSLNALLALGKSLDSVANFFLTVQQVLKIGSTQSLSARATKLRGLIQDAKKTVSAAQESLDELKAIKSSASQESDEVTSFRQMVEDHSEAIQAAKLRSEELLADAQNSHEAVVGILDKGEALEVQIGEQQEKLNDFDASLTLRQRELADAIADLQDALSKNEAREEEVSRLIEKSNAMIKGATVAGLATSFSDLADRYETEVKLARFAFYFSIFVLMLTMLPLLFFFLPEISVAGDNVASKFYSLLQSSGEKRLPELLSRVIFLLPGAWLAKFSSSRYKRAFRLLNHFDHKAALAQSIEGFKAEAPNYKQEIAAAVFWDLTQRSQRDGVKTDASDVPNPILRYLLDKFEAEKEEQV